MKQLDRSLWGGVVEAQGAIYRVLVAPGALVTVASGLVITLSMYTGLCGQVGPWLGMTGVWRARRARCTLLGAMPAAAKLSRLEPLGPSAAAFDALRKRLAITGSIGGTLALLALVAGALYRHG